jgi:hypothetical protein
LSCAATARAREMVATAVEKNGLMANEEKQRPGSEKVTG